MSSSPRSAAIAATYHDVFNTGSRQIRLAIMPCLPESGGCERPYTDVLVAHLNRVENAHYTHRSCLDVADRTVPQPEALYVDSESGRQLVIERKSISWPVDYPRRHKNDHAVSDLFARELRDLTVDDLYEIRLPMLMVGKREELLSNAAEAVKQIRAKWPAISTGSILEGQSWGSVVVGVSQTPRLGTRRQRAEQRSSNFIDRTFSFLRRLTGPRPPSRGIVISDRGYLLSLRRKICLLSGR